MSRCEVQWRMRVCVCMPSEHGASQNHTLPTKSGHTRASQCAASSWGSHVHATAAEVESNHCVIPHPWN